MRWRVCDLIDRLAGEERTGLIFVDEYGHRRDYTFAEIAAYSSRYAAVLRAFGVDEGERVHVRLSTTGKCIFTLLALERLRARAILDEGDGDGASTVIADRKYRGEIDAGRDRFAADARYIIIGEECEGWARVDTLAQIASPFKRATEDADDENIDRARAQASNRLSAVASDVVWCTLQTADGNWFDGAVAQPWLCGAAVVAHNGSFDARERLDLIRELDVTILLQRAREYQAELSLPDVKSFKMPRLRRCIVLDAGCDETLSSQWAERFGVLLTADVAAASPHQ